MNFKEYIKIREEKFGSVIFDTLREKVFITNKTGGIILQLMKENKPLEEIVACLLDRYDEDSPVISAGLTTFVEDLRKEGVLI